MEHVETLIVGGGQAGLTMSHHLTRRGQTHLILERARIAERWRSERWDSLRFQTPNALVQLPDFPFPHVDPNAFAAAGEIVDYLVAYAAHINAPVRCGVTVTTLRRQTGALGFVAETSDGPINASNVVVATGPYQRANMPVSIPEMPGVVQIHAKNYMAPSQLPTGAILVVGSGASGAQIGEELMRAGRHVYLSISKHRRAPRRYRGKDFAWWLIETGLYVAPQEKRGPDQSAVVLTGAYGGHTIDFRDFARKGMSLLGRVDSFQDGVLTIVPDLLENLAHGDSALLTLLDWFDTQADLHGWDLPPDAGARIMAPSPAALSEPMSRLDLSAAEISAVIWATGYGLDFGWVDMPVFDARGAPFHQKGVTDVPGLYFLGLEFLSTMSSAFLRGVGDDASYLADHIIRRNNPCREAS